MNVSYLTNGKKFGTRMFKWISVKFVKATALCKNGADKYSHSWNQRRPARWKLSFLRHTPMIASRDRAPLVRDIFVFFEINRSNTIRIKMQLGAEQSFCEHFFDCARYISIKFHPHLSYRQVEFLFSLWYSIPIPLSIYRW